MADRDIVYGLTIGGDYTFYFERSDRISGVVKRVHADAQARPVSVVINRKTTNTECVLRWDSILYATRRMSVSDGD